jgi:hypothetical protein
LLSLVGAHLLVLLSGVLLLSLGRRSCWCCCTGVRLRLCGAALLLLRLRLRLRGVQLRLLSLGTVLETGTALGCGITGRGDRCAGGEMSFGVQWMDRGAK